MDGEDTALIIAYCMAIGGGFLLAGPWVLVGGGIFGIAYLILTAYLKATGF